MQAVERDKEGDVVIPQAFGGSIRTTGVNASYSHLLAGMGPIMADVLTVVAIVFISASRYGPHRHSEGQNCGHGPDAGHTATQSSLGRLAAGLDDLLLAAEGIIAKRGACRHAGRHLPEKPFCRPW